MILFFQVLIIDPTSTETRPLLKMVENLVSHTAPIRVGIVFSTNDDSKINGNEDAGVGMVCAFNYVMQLKDSHEGLNFIIEVSNKINDFVLCFFKYRS